MRFLMRLYILLVAILKSKKYTLESYFSCISKQTTGKIIEKHINWHALTFPLWYVYDGSLAPPWKPPETINLHISPLKQTFFAIPQNYTHMGIFS